MYPELIRRYHQMYNNHPIVSKMDEPNQVGISIPYAECEYSGIAETNWQGVMQVIQIKICNEEMLDRISYIRLENDDGSMERIEVANISSVYKTYHKKSGQSFIKGKKYSFKSEIYFIPGITDFSYCFGINGTAKAGLTSIKFSYINCKDTISYEGMFQNQNLLTLIDMSQMQTPYVSNMRFMFASCAKLHELRIGSNFVIDKEFYTNNSENFHLWTSSGGFDENFIVKTYPNKNDFDIFPENIVESRYEKNPENWFSGGRVMRHGDLNDNNYIEW